jgi:lipid A ethanolaminephosphotransferase
MRVSAIYDFGPREELEPIAASDPPAKNVIFVIDESIRGDHLSLNGYHRRTTPYLDELFDKGLLLNWGIADSVTTCSQSSDLLLLSGLTLQDLPDLDNKAMKVPTIFQYAKALGYRTYYFDGQMNTFWNVKLRDMKYIDEWWNVNKLLQINNDYQQVDFVIAEAVRSVVTTSRGNFIWIIKAGAHVPYHKRFPESAAQWLPSYAGDRWDVHRQSEIVNAYDNAIRYNVDGFFSHLIPDHKAPDDTVIVYTSDHGQTLAEGGEGSSHCGYTRNEAIVPLFIIGYMGFGIDTKYKASNPNLFATLLDLMGFPESARKRSYGRSLLKAREADSEPRYYVGPTLRNLQKLKFD